MADPHELTPDQIEAALELQAIRDQVKDMKAEEETLRKKLLAALDGNPSGVTAKGHELVTAKVQTRTGIDRKKLEARYPDVFDDVTTESDSVTVKVADLPAEEILAALGF